MLTSMLKNRLNTPETQLTNSIQSSTTICRLSLVASLLIMLLVGCGQNNHRKPEADANNSLKLLAGCYTVSKDEPAQIKISQTVSNTQDVKNNWVMQMREENSKNSEIGKGNWDTHEPLEVLTTMGEGQYFSVDNNQIDAIIARPDKMMVIAHVKQTYVNIDPLLDSEYLAYIYQGANSIYKVECE